MKIVFISSDNRAVITEEGRLHPDVLEWLSNIGEPNLGTDFQMDLTTWRPVYTVPGVEFRFASDDDALLFKLQFGGKN